MRNLREVGWLRGHRAALHWLWTIYRAPRKLREQIGRDYPDKQSRRTRLLLTSQLLTHALPYLVLAAFLARLLGNELAGKSASTLISAWRGQVFLSIGTVVVGAISGVAIGIVASFIGDTVETTASDVAVGVGLGLSLGVWSGLFEFSETPLTLTTVSVVMAANIFGLVIAMDRAFGPALFLVVFVGSAAGLFIGMRGGGLAAGIVAALAFGLLFIAIAMRAYYQWLAWWLTWPWPMTRLFRFHPAIWDDVCGLPFPNFSSLLVAYAAWDRGAADSEIDRLVRDSPPQRPAALRARTILIARDAGKVERLAQLEALLGRLPHGARGYLMQTPELQQWAGELVAQAARVETTGVPVIRAAEAAELCLRARELTDRIAGFEEPLASAFIPAAEHWLRLAQRLREEAREASDHAAWPQVFRAGDRIEDRDREAFVRRDSVLDELRQQLLLGSGCPGIVLYGRRRVGKSTVLTNLAGFLPDSISVVVLSMQNPELFTDLAGFCGRVVGEAEQALPSELREPNAARTLPELWRALAGINARLARAGRQLLIAIDEYENLDLKIGQGVFPEDLLAGLRESLQGHRRIIWLLAGSHSIDELTNAPWASYLVSARTVEVSMFTADETTTLLTDPMRHAPRRSLTVESSVNFSPAFWGPGGISRLHNEAGGWPHLVQLIAETLIDEVNRAGAAAADATLFERGLERAIVRGHNVLDQLLRRECRQESEWTYLSGFRSSDIQDIPPDAVRSALQRRLLIHREGNGFRLRVPIMQRWLRQRS